MSAVATNSSTFAALNVSTPDAVRISFRAPISEKWLCCVKITGCPASCCAMENVRQRIYFYVMENRIEYNYPSFCAPVNCLSGKCCKPQDNVHVMYFDHTLTQNAAKATACAPFCTHCSCFPSCCDLCGECLVIHSDGKCGGLCCRKFSMLPGFEDATSAANAIMQARAMMAQRNIQPCPPGATTGAPQAMTMTAQSTVMQTPGAYGY